MCSAGQLDGEGAAELDPGAGWRTSCTVLTSALDLNR